LSGHWPLPKVGGRATRYIAFVDIINHALEFWQPRNVYIENPLPPQAQTDADTCRKIYALVGFTEEACGRAGVAFGGESVNSIRTDVIGRCHWPDGKTKPHVVSFVRNQLRMDVWNNDEADAIIVWLDYRQKMHGTPSAKHPLFRWNSAES